MLVSNSIMHFHANFVWNCSWLIEINASPSLTASNKEDYELKFGLLDDVINVVDLETRSSSYYRLLSI